MEGEALKEGKARVRSILIDPLIAQGMSRGRMTLMQEREFLNSIEARLAYMSEENLAALGETVAALAKGKLQNQWPTEITICNWARRLQVPPAGASRLVRSMLQSAAGERAQIEGHLTELMLHLKKYGAPPNDYGWSMIRQKADENKGRMARIEREQQVGSASPSDLAWLRGYMAQREMAQAIRDAKGGDE